MVVTEENKDHREVKTTVSLKQVKSSLRKKWHSKILNK